MLLSSQLLVPSPTLYVAPAVKHFRELALTVFGVPAVTSVDSVRVYASETRKLGIVRDVILSGWLGMKKGLGWCERLGNDEGCVLKGDGSFQVVLKWVGDEAGVSCYDWWPMPCLYTR